MGKIILFAGLLASLALAGSIWLCTDRDEERIVVAAQKSEDSQEGFSLTARFCRMNGEDWYLDAPPEINAAASRGDLMSFRYWSFRLPLTRWTWTSWDHRLVRDDETIVHVRTGTGDMLLRGARVASVPFVLACLAAAISALATRRHGSQ